jgi:formyl-CoA transferase
MSRARVSLRRAPPRLGQHNDEVLGELSQAPVSAKVEAA